MNLIDHYAMKTARAIRKHYPEAASEKILFYALSLSFNTLLAFFTALFVCYLTDHLFYGIISIVCFVGLRYLSGGVHLHSSLACCIFTIILIISSSHITFNYHVYGIFMDMFSLIIMILKSPQGLQNVSRINTKYYPLLKISCVAFVSINFFIQSPMLSTIFLTQSITLTNTAYKLVHIFERRWLNEN